MKTYEGSIPSSYCSIGTVVEDVISRIKATCGCLEESALFDLTVVLNELILNAVKHGNKGDVSKRVKIKVAIKDGGFVCVIVEDEGSGYDYRCLCKSKEECIEANDFSELMESGRGILIVKSLCDKVRVNNKGNKIAVLKKL